VAKQEALSAEEYTKYMMERIYGVYESWLNALKEVQKENLRVAKAYNKRVVIRSFQVKDLVWKMILPIGKHDNRFSKWSPSWKGPYMVSNMVPGNAYFVKTLEGQELPKALNGKYLKKYYPSMWQEA
jgi:hypothetical protein